MHHPLRSLSAALLMTLAAAGANATCGGARYWESGQSPSGDWDDVFGQAAGILPVSYQDVPDQNCPDAEGSLGGLNDLSDRFQIKVMPDPIYGGVIFTQIYFETGPDDGFLGSVNQGTFLSVSRVESPDVPLFTMDAPGRLSPKFLIGYGTYVVTVGTRALHYPDGTPGRFFVEFLVEQVPEPATYALWLGGLALVAGAAYRRQSRP